MKNDITCPGYIAVHRDTGEPWDLNRNVNPWCWADVRDSVSMAKRRFTELANLGSFNKQTDYVIAKVVNPIKLKSVLNEMRQTPISRDDMIDTILDMMESE